MSRLPALVALPALPCRLLLLIAIAAAAAPSLAAELTAELSKDKNAVTIKIDGRPLAEYLFRSGNKPILWPIIGPTGQPMTRAYPMVAQTKEADDHVHHRSMWFSHGDVNGVNFWAEGPKCGTIRQRELVKTSGGQRATVVTNNDWLGPDGKRQCEDQRTLTFSSDGDARQIDFDIVIHASNGPVKFADNKEGTFGIRVAESLRVDAKQGGQLINSQGQSNEAAWGKPASWVDYHGPLNGQTVGIAILNHTGSFRYPTPWHVRTYGLFAANPFGLRALGGKKDVDGSYTIPADGNIALHYRLILHRGDEKTGHIAEAFAKYAKESK